MRLEVGQDEARVGDDWFYRVGPGRSMLVGGGGDICTWRGHPHSCSHTAPTVLLMQHADSAHELMRARQTSPTQPLTASRGMMHC